MCRYHLTLHLSKNIRIQWHPSFTGLHFLIKNKKRLRAGLSGLELVVAANTKRDSTARAPRSHALRGNAYRKALPSICESQLPYDPHACMYPKTEAEPLKLHSQAEPGNERNPLRQGRKRGIPINNSSAAEDIQNPLIPF